MPRNSDKNRCRASEIEPLAKTRTKRSASAAPESPPAAQVRRTVESQLDDSEEANESRLFTDDAKLEMFKRYLAWVEGGKAPEDSPIEDLVKEYGEAGD